MSRLYVNIRKLVEQENVRSLFSTRTVSRVSNGDPS